MGYTHYWKHPELDADVWKNRFMPAARRVLQSEADLLCLEYDTPDEPPELSIDRVFFNGKEDDGHETFVVTTDACSFAFCKTNRKPYDTAVIAILTILDRLYPDFSWSSDGDGPELAEGQSLGLQCLQPLHDADAD